VDAAFQILRAHYPQFIMCSAIAYLPSLIIQIIWASDPAQLAISPGASVIVGMAMWLGFALMSAVLIVCASQAYLGDPIDVAGAVRKALPRMPFVLIGAFVRYIAFFLGVFTLFIGTFYFMARWFAVTPAIVLERRGVGASLSRSAALSKGRKGHIIGTYLLIALIYLPLVAGVQIAAALLLKNLTLQAIVTALFTILIYPFIAITEALLYFDARIKHEGFDIELMAGALDGGAVAPSREAAAP